MDPSRPRSRRIRGALVAVLLSASLAGCGHDDGPGSSSHSPSPDVPTDAGYDTPAASPTPTGPPPYSASHAELRAYLHLVIGAVGVVARLDRRDGRLMGTDHAAQQARIDRMRHDLPILRTIGDIIVDMPVHGGDLPRLHRLLVVGVRAQVRGYELWTRAWRLNASSIVPRADEKLAEARTAKEQYLLAIRSLGGRVPV
ncbi:MAG: hypothetical protein JWN22_2074 [Nocardioides sp.]|jgi:hypothetical protein|nr:hypothetical protein [Nocardioides sp.]